MARIKYVSPEAPVPEASHAAASRAPEASGLRLGILDNTKGNADHLLSLLATGLRAELSIASIVSRRKSSASRGAEKQLLDELAAEADCVVSAMAD